MQPPEKKHNINNRRAPRVARPCGPWLACPTASLSHGTAIVGDIAIEVTERVSRDLYPPFRPMPITQANARSLPKSLILASGTVPRSWAAIDQNLPIKGSIDYVARSYERPFEVCLTASREFDPKP